MEEQTADQRFLLQYIQPGLLGLMDGTVSTLAPLFAAAFATHNTHTTFVIGMSAAIGAAISMGFAEALSDTGVHTNRGHPIKRGFVTGGMTLLGGILHTVPFLASSMNTALVIAYAIVGVELIAISFVRYRYFQMNFILSMVQVVVGGGLVVLAGIFIGSS